MMALKHSHGDMTLGWLLQELQPVSADADREFADIKLDSREVLPGDVFFALRGIASSGEIYIEHAVAQGAVAIVADDSFNLSSLNLDIPVVQVARLNEKVGQLAHRFFQCPSDEMTLVGITGTNGKTSVANLLAQALAGPGKKLAASIGTLGSGVPGELVATANTTPDAISIQRILCDMRGRGIKSVAMEVSSHALSQYRVAGISFDIGVFTNLSQDHLDYHGDMQSYANTKKRLFEMQGMHTAVINTDDEFGRQLAAELGDSLKVYTYGLNDRAHDLAHLSGEIAVNKLGELQVDVNGPWGNASICSRLSGSFNALNLLAGFSVLCVTGMSAKESAAALAQLQPVPGRMECFTGKDGKKIIVDYAHTPDALEKALQGLRKIHQGKIITVAGCGGDRDSAKRPLMGEIAEKYSDTCIFTSDNPRFEEPMKIIEQMLAGTSQPGSIEVIEDRAKAIERAISIAGHSDAVLVAGKGHETYQEIKGVRNPFSDRQLVRELLGDVA